MLPKLLIQESPIPSQPTGSPARLHQPPSSSSSPSIPWGQGGSAPARCPRRAAVSALHREDFGGREGARCSAGPCSPSAPKAPSVPGPKTNGGLGAAGACTGATQPPRRLRPPQRPSHPKVVTVQFNLCCAWRREAGCEEPLSCAGESRPSVRERALNTVSAQTN